MTQSKQNTPDLPELKPCPFCGGEELSDGFSAPPYQAIVQCHSCGGIMVSDESEEACRDAWNTRAAEAVGGEVESVLTRYERDIIANTPMGHENKNLGASTYNWRKHVLAEIRAMVPAAQPSNGAGLDVPEGWKLVPIEPTDEMVSAGMKAQHEWSAGLEKIGVEAVGNYRAIFTAMLSAAPSEVGGV